MASKTKLTFSMMMSFLTGFMVLFHLIYYRNSTDSITIKNATDSYIKEIHVNGGANLLLKGELAPKASQMVELDCSQAGATSKITLVFDDNHTYIFVDQVCNPNKVWEITEDGNHSEKDDD